VSGLELEYLRITSFDNIPVTRNSIFFHPDQQGDATLAACRNARVARLKAAEVEISALKSAIREVAISAFQAVRSKETPSDNVSTLERTNSGASVAEEVGEHPNGSS
jgi:hypothetical protein